MGKILMGLGLIIVLAGAGLFALASWSIPAPTAHVEKVLPDEAFPK